MNKIADFGGVGVWPGGEAITYNIDPTAKPDVVVDICDQDALRSSIKEQHSAIWCVHTLEHLKPSSFAGVLSMWRQFIVPGGYCMIVVPDGERIIEDYNNGLIPWDVMIALMYVETPNYPQEEGYSHRFTFNTLSLTKVMKAAGYKNVRREKAGWYKQWWEFDYLPYVHLAPGYMVRNIVMIGEV